MGFTSGVGGRVGVAPHVRVGGRSGGGPRCGRPDAASPGFWRCGPRCRGARARVPGVDEPGSWRVQGGVGVGEVAVVDEARCRAVRVARWVRASSSPSGKAVAGCRAWCGIPSRAGGGGGAEPRTVAATWSWPARRPSRRDRQVSADRVLLRGGRVSPGARPRSAGIVGGPGVPWVASQERGTPAAAACARHGRGRWGRFGGPVAGRPRRWPENWRGRRQIWAWSSHAGGRARGGGGVSGDWVHAAGSGR